MGALLRTLVASKPGGAFLELGTGTGLATAWMLDGMNAGASLVTIDNDPQPQSVARECLGDDPRLSLVVDDGIRFLQTQPDSSFDLVFADAMPGKYDGLDEALRLVRQGGYYVIDDMLAQPNWPEGHAAKVPLLMEQLAAHPGFVITPLTWASGVVIAVRVAASDVQ
jgi:predicted O-methyltransferase YrrM